jgi:antitoxin VapB
MKIATSRTFKSGNSEAVRLPKEMAFGEGVELELIKSGNVLTVRPKAKMNPKELADALRRLPKPDRIEEREPIEFPERSGL